MPFADLKTHKLFYKDFQPVSNNDSQLPLVFLHGFTLDHRMWEADAVYYSKWYRVILLDSKGHGLSDAPESGYSRADRVKDLVNFLNSLSIDKVHLIGLSMGGTTALGFALEYPERLASLTLISTSAAGYDAGPKISKIDRIAREKGIEKARDKWIKTTLLWYREDKKHIRNLLKNMMLEHSGAIWKDPMRGRYPRTYDLEHIHEIKTRTKILVGEKDNIFLPLSKKIHQLIPNSELSIFESTGHILNLEAPDKFHSELKLFLEGA